MQDDLIKSLTNKLEKHEQVIRRKNLRIYGVKEVENENCLEVVLDVLNNKMKLAVKKEDIDNCHRYGKILKERNRPLLIKFSSACYKNLVYNNKKVLKNSGIVVREDLTEDQLNLLNTTLKKVDKIGRVWTNFGTIFLKFNNENAIVRINSLDDVNQL